MAEKTTTIDMNNTEEKKLISNRIQGFEINISKEHGNWLTVGEIIRFIQKPISKYVDEIVKALHKKLCNDLVAIGKCCNPGDCKKKTKPKDLCRSCQAWIKELRTSHEKGDNPAWHKNCDSSRWSEDHWEVAKFFMPALGNNLTTVKDAETTDLSSLLNVLEWMKDKAFLGKTRVNVELVRKLRSQVRNTWAHAPNQELTDDEKGEGFSIANDLLEDLEKVFSNTENGECLEYLDQLNADGITNVAESELQYLLLQCHLLHDIKEDIIRMNDGQLSDKIAIGVRQRKLNKLECALKECLQRMADFKNLKENINKQFNIFQEKLESFSAIPKDIREIRNDIGQIRDHLSMMNNCQNKAPQPTSCLPEKVPMFTAREAEIEKVVSSLKDEGKAVVSIYGGPGFGKTAIAVQVSHKLSIEHNIPVVFTDVSRATTVEEMILLLCRDVGINHENDPKSSLVLWLKNIKVKDKVIFVMDDIDNILEKKTRDNFDNFIHLLRQSSHQRCQIVTTSRKSYKIPQISTAEVKVNEMDDETSIKLLGEICQKEDCNFLLKLAKLCGNIPLAMCIAGSRVDDFENSDELLQHLDKQPMETLECPERNQYVSRAINMSYEMLNDEQKQIFVRLAVFEGSFSEGAAREVIEKGKLDTTRILKDLVSRSLIKQPTKHRYSIHLLIKQFLKVQAKSEGKRAAKERAKVLMVGYYLKLGNDLTIKSYSKDGYKENREDLKKEAHNIQNVLKICCQEKNSTSEISKCLVGSEIYTTSSSRYFSLFVRTIIPGSTVDQFLQCCARLAEEKEQHAIKITFDCLLADQERSKPVGTKSNELFNSKMTEIIREFEMHYEEVKEDKSICAHYYYQYGRYLQRESENDSGKRRSISLNKAREQFENSLALRRKLVDTSVGKADMVFLLLQLGNVWKKIANTERFLKQREACDESTKKAQKYFEEAIQLSESDLGEHDLTSMCYKNLADQLLTTENYEKAEENYRIAKKMQENLGLDVIERHVFLLNNLGQCLTLTNRAKQAVELLESARDMAEKLAESDDPNDCKTKVYKSLAIAYYDSVEFEKAANYAKKALMLEKTRSKSELEELKKIICKWESIQKSVNKSKMSQTTPEAENWRLHRYSK